MFMMFLNNIYNFPTQRKKKVNSIRMLYEKLIKKEKYYLKIVKTLSYTDFSEWR